MSAAKKNKNEGPSRAMIMGYKCRLDYIKQGQMYENKGELINAITVYEKYFEVVAKWHKVEKEKLKPEMFKKLTKEGLINEKEDDLHEIFLISLVSWNLARIYAYSDKEKHLEKLKIMLDRFVLFSIGYKFQFLNCETLRKYLKKVTGPQEKLMEEAYQKLRVHSKRCYLATHCFGENHPHLFILRSFRDNYLDNWGGEQFLKFYYTLSPGFITYCQRHKYCDQLLTPAIRLFIHLIILFLPGKNKKKICTK
ncbi:MAG: hypothetical protein A2381_12145 [Bdellovibrionales bacterium RIFOXYB1_FULL_37_110]|nr:MAG: hypothetical protein A2181_01865 [Bdellovibrionales bacterium RIFOXYA1_FULL_38_20]OFZ52246.1 MAG: hypothetical protein A2417_05985 [Bdellovibrionales bacterium RIFOXYC1_FULL_37_79]OFZ57233.1 MAG: hypothetical protein A2381_12145 [Bdellovibrionales bacterium RIFOXYB1_FULL_37_110]OFZ65235.1 MAG: hypothetical protein A2577_04580 [Bdellovibrionales bacterium RIFOXYD1_FULL_36_51]